jgi:hypothetical protein
MAYTINLTDGNVFATIPDGTTNTSSSLTLIGKNYAGYGQFLDDNFIQHLENFSSASAGGNPTVAQLAAPLTGQLWWDKTNSLLKVYSGGVAGWKTISAASASSSQPGSSVVGDLWFDTTNQQLKVCTIAGTPGTFLVVGPAYTSSSGTAGAIPETINESGTGTPHFVTSLYVNNSRVAIVSKDANFPPAAPTNATFPTIYNGITLWNSGSPVFGGSATNAQTLDSLDSLDFMRATANTTTTGTVRVLNDTGLFVGAANVFNVNVSGNDARIKSDISNGNLTIQANVAGTTFNVAQALGATGVFAVSNAITVGTTASAVGNITGGNLRTGGVISATGNITGGNIAATAHTGTTVSVTGNVDAGNLRTGGLISATGNINAANISGTYFLGNGSQLTGLSLGVSVTKFVNGTSEGNVGVTNGNITFTVGGTANVVVISPTTTYFSGNVSVPGIEKTGISNVGNIGQLDNWFNRAFVTAYQAQYADVAERFASDEPLDAGTVVELGGTKEITKSLVDLSENVFGVISTDPAYLMNGSAGTDQTHPPVAMTGRVPVKVTGIINKGDRLVSAGNGTARAAQAGEATSFNVIGRALVDKTTPEEGTIEAIVATK